ncbi:enoyl-CoA hydratase/isomerase family protein [Novosphingobium sp. FSW06-99]|uniref:enoyl-CoA hydratase/isomerase family protein n=1 Tax=Novosphingobium sp. FSW06-99 TaxID=1739113 RepID=UPI00076D9417|nr:enoyl-CoA hydratase/isomerase family protein [Novosphingobium sp. FSW06-99]KUR78078.1 enoyl-CoA hydratase [Novosphingobium sp. FSW06-99]
MTDEILARIAGRVGHLSLNRPKAIHALTLPMVRAMIAALLAWRDDAAVAAVLIDHAEGRGFCAGGDIAFLRDSALNDGGASGRQFFYEEYQLNHLILTYPKPVITVMDGITMGGGVGIAGPATIRIATEATRLAMPETGIGLFPDVGGGWYLSRLAGRLGHYMALTGARLDGADCLWTGLATHYLPSAALAEAKAALFTDPDQAAAILHRLAAVPPEAKIAAQADTIDRLFASDRYEDILAALAADGGDWASATLATLATKSPQTCKVALRQLHDSLHCEDFAANMAMEYRIGARVLVRPDFAEGVRAVIIDKDHAPRWNPPTPEAVTPDLLDAIFAPLPADEEWKPL